MRTELECRLLAALYCEEWERRTLWILSTSSRFDVRNGRNARSFQEMLLQANSSESRSQCQRPNSTRTLRRSQIQRCMRYQISPCTSLKHHILLWKNPLHLTYSSRTSCYFLLSTRSPKPNMCYSVTCERKEQTTTMSMIIDFRERESCRQTASLPT